LSIFMGDLNLILLKQYLFPKKDLVLIKNVNLSEKFLTIFHLLIEIKKTKNTD